MSQIIHDPNENPAALAVSPTNQIAAIAATLDKAVLQGVPAESLEKVVALYERLADRQAAQEFACALMRFQTACTAIPKDSRAEIVTNAGVKYGYNFASLDQIIKIIRPLMAAEGLSISWDSTEADNKVKCECIVRHTNGHIITASFTAPTDSAAKMSGAQRNASALTYARRQSLIAALGLVTCDPADDDAGSGAPLATITDEQALTLEGIMADMGMDDAGKARFFAWAGVDRLADIPATSFGMVKATLEAKRKKAT